MPKKKIAIYSAAGCRTCENSILDIQYCVSPLTRWAEVSFWPYVIGSQWGDLDRLESLDLCFFAGAIRTRSDREAAVRLRAKSGRMVACGACACYGGLPGLANFSRSRVSRDVPQPESVADADVFPLPIMEDRVSALSQVVKVDYFVPGCPPTISFLWAAFQSLVSGVECQVRISFLTSRLPESVSQAVLSGMLPPVGSIFSGERAVCASCSRTKEKKQFKHPVRSSEKNPEPGRCLLEQGYLCLGIVTREGCGGLCPAAGLPCRGCFGKTDSVLDPGAKMISAVGSTFESTSPEETEKIVEEFVDLRGTLYRYTAASQCALLSRPKKVCDDI